MIINEKNDNTQPPQTAQKPPQTVRKSGKPAKKSRVRSIAGALVSDILIAAILFGVFYVSEYGVPFSQQVYAVASNTEATAQLLLNQTASASDDAAADADSTAGTTSEAEADTASAAGTSETASAAAGNTASSVDAVVTDNTYTSDNLQITVTQYSSGTGSSKITWYAADIQVTDLALFSTCFADDAYGQGITDYVLNMALNNDAVLAVNGDYYSDQKNNIVIRNGQLYEEADTSSDLCVLYKDGTIATYSPGEITAAQAIADGAWQAWCFGPALLADDGSSVTSFNTSSRIAESNPRTALGYYEPGHYCLVVVDGRSAGYSKGMTLTELSQLFEDLGCTAAYNLDGGKSSVMVFNGVVVNQPCDGGREVSDAITIG